MVSCPVVSSIESLSCRNNMLFGQLLSQELLFHRPMSSWLVLELTLGHMLSPANVFPLAVQSNALYAHPLLLFITSFVDVLSVLVVVNFELLLFESCAPSLIPRLNHLLLVQMLGLFLVVFLDCLRLVLLPVYYLVLGLLVLPTYFLTLTTVMLFQDVIVLPHHQT